MTAPPASASPRSADPPPVRAAGAVCWRRAADDGLEVLLVRSARWGEWGWPKGKAEPGEPLPVTAVRELAEETGQQVRLGRPLPGVAYVLPDGRPKTVAYWAAQVTGSGPPAAGPEEIAEVAWLPVVEALHRLTRPGDLAPLDRLLDLEAAGELDTRAVVVLRHGTAVPRKQWAGTEAERPLTAEGREQAAALVRLLASWWPRHVLTSPWRRCADTVAPWVQAAGVTAEERDDLTEAILEADPGAPGAALLLALGRAGAGDAVLLCTHRPVLATLVRQLSRLAPVGARGALPTASPWLAKGEALVLHVIHGRADHLRGLAATERHIP